MWKYPLYFEGHASIDRLSLAICQNLGKRPIKPSRFFLISTFAHVRLSHSIPYSHHTSSLTSLRLLGPWVPSTFLQVIITKLPLHRLPSSSWTQWSIHSFILTNASTANSLFFYPAYPQPLIISIIIFLHSFTQTAKCNCRKLYTPRLGAPENQIPNISEALSAMTYKIGDTPKVGSWFHNNKQFSGNWNIRIIGNFHRLLIKSPLVTPHLLWLQQK